MSNDYCKEWKIKSPLCEGKLASCVAQGFHPEIKAKAQKGETARAGMRFLERG